MTIEDLHHLDIKSQHLVTGTLTYKQCRVDGCVEAPTIVVRADTDIKNDMIGLCETHKI